MKSIFSKIKRRFKMTYKSFKSDCNFSVKLAFLRVADELGGRIGFKKLSNKAHLAKDKWILNYLKNDLLPVINELKEDRNFGTAVKNAPIWVCWWTGEDDAPALVKRCIKSIRDNANGHPVYFIDRSNYTDYIDIPEHIISKVNSGEMCLANFSDILRVTLIKQHGGLWLDSTIYCSQPIPDTYFEFPMFSCKSQERDCGYISRMRWTAFVMGGFTNNVFFRYMHAAFSLYWQKNSVSIDYLLVDYLIELAYQEIPAIKELLNNIPINNVHRDDLQSAMNQCLDASEFDNVIKSDTVLYKLSWRECYSCITNEGNESIFSLFIS